MRGQTSLGWPMLLRACWALVVLVVLLGVRANAADSDRNYETQLCAPYGGITQWNTHWQQHPFSECHYSDRCPNCIGFCYARQIACRNGQNFIVWSQLRPYESDAWKSAEWSAIQEHEQRENAKLSSAAAWANSSPIPQFLLLGLSIALTFVAWRGLSDDDWRMAPLVLFNAYLAVSLLFFNTTEKGSYWIVHQLDTMVFFHSWLFFAAFVGFVAVAVQPFIQGWDYLFVKHPAEPVVEQALSSGEAIDHQALSAALATNPAEFDQLQPKWHYKHQAEKARALIGKLEEDARLAEAAIERERARATQKSEYQTRAAMQDTAPLEKLEPRLVTDEEKRKLHHWAENQWNRYRE